MITIRIRSIVLFAAGAAIALVLAAVFAGVRAGAATDAEESAFVPITPCRLFDTRPAPSTVGLRSSPLSQADTHTQQVTGTVGNCAIPSGATAVAMNVTITNPTSRSFLTLYPSDVTRPLASNLNWLGDQSPTPNKVDVALSTDGRINIYNENGTVNVFADVVGYYSTTGLTDLQDQIDALSEALDASKVRTDVYDGRALQYLGGSTSTLNGCVWIGTDFNQYLPVTVPLGSTILAVEARVLDTFSTAYEVSFVRRSFRSDPVDGFQTEELATATGGDLSIVLVDHDLTPTSTETVDEGESFLIEFDANAGAGAVGSDHGLCQVSITYREP